MDFENETLRGEVILDGNNYKNCTFEQVQFVYGGGTLNMDNCFMNEFSWRFTGDLANGLFALHQLFGTEGLLTIIRGFVEPKPGVVELPPA